MTTFGDQVFEYGGAPVGSGRFSSPWATHWFVDFDNGSASNGGKRPDDAYKTIQAAVTASTGGDVIYIAPRQYQLGQGFRRYVEDITVTQGGTAGSGNVATNANKSLIGITQRQYPSDMVGVRTKYSTAGHGGWNIEAPGTHLENIGVFAEDATTYAIFFESDGATRSKGWDGCSMYKVMVKGKEVRFSGGGGDVSIVNCKFQCKYDGTGTPQLNLIGSAGTVNRMSVISCDFIGGNANNYATAPVTGAAPVTSFVMRDCHFSQDPDSGDFINFAGISNSGVVTNCFFGSESLAAKLGTLTSGSSGIHSAGLFDENGAVDMS
jgi:hypothetical protein